MVFSRYASVFRTVSKTLGHRSFLATNDFLRRTRIGPSVKNTRRNSIQQSEKIGESPLTKSARPEATILHESQVSSEFGRKTLTSHVEEQRSDAFEASNSAEEWDDPTSDSYIYEDVKMPKALDRCDEDLSHIAPSFVPTFNFAAYANDSPVIQELLKLGVDLHRVEKRPDIMERLLKRNFDELKPHIRFLHDCGVPAENLGAVLTKNPFLLEQSIDDMSTRIRYLRAHKFTTDMVASIVTRNPFWLMFETKRIDARLGHFQLEFGLNGFQIRRLAAKQPRLITFKFRRIRENTFAVREEMGFDKDETKVILMDKPRLFMKNRKKLVDLFDYVHNTMKLSHEIIAKEPKILTCRLERLRQRHGYLEAVGKAQYDPTKPMYVSPEALISGTDVEFCRDVAKTTVFTYNMYLKTL